MKYSLIIPVYNRPDEIVELLQSLLDQKRGDFEVIVVEDGSVRPCRDAISSFFTSGLDLHYLVKENGGPGLARNYGARHAKGDYLIILDSDVTLPKGYFDAVDKELQREVCDAFGGPDRAEEGFTEVQKAISYSMTSFFTTGGIRGGRKKLDKFYPRSFNMGIRRDVFERLGGYSKMRFGEDIDLSIRIVKAGYTCRLFPEAWVCHKRRTDFWKFFKQVHNSGIARINLYKKYPDSLKAVHLLPAGFTIVTTFLLLGGFCRPWLWAPVGLYSLLLLLDSSISNKGNLRTGILSVVAAFVQLYGYGSGFLRAWWERCVLGRGDVEAFKKNFYN